MGGITISSSLGYWDDAMKLRTKLAFALSIPFLGFFAFGVTDVGQRVLIGKLPPNVDHWKADDVYMGAGLAPWVYGLVPFIPLCLFGLVSWLLERTKFLQRPG
jgi:hypothetical protein